MKRAFTLIELLIVIAVLVILMGLVFRLVSAGSDSLRRTETVMRMQRLENCLSGYYAAFGNYPRVRVHGTRDIYEKVDVHGIQTGQKGSKDALWGWTNIGEQNELGAWSQVQAACRSQPLDCRYPYPKGMSDVVDAVAAEMKARAESGDDAYKAYFEDPNVRAQLTAGFDDGVTRNTGRYGSKKKKEDWREIQLFKFGLMSYLLPRYLIMMNGDEVFFSEYAQWTGNNELPSNALTGQNYKDIGGWAQLRKHASGENQSQFAAVANIPSQAVCARWVANLEGICQANHDYTLFGVDIRDHKAGSELTPANINIEIFAPRSAQSSSTANQYVLDGITVRDGWGQDFYYYSPEPYQTYTLWSAGPNGRTFPPWVDRSEKNKDMSSKANECISKWVEDDIVHLSN